MESGAPHVVWRLIASCISASRPGKHKVSGSGSLQPWSASTAVSAASSGAGRRWTVARALRHWAAARRARTRRTVPSWAPRSISWSISGARRWPLTSVAPTNRQMVGPRLVVHVAVKRPASQQHFCGDKGYDSTMCAGPSPGRLCAAHQRKRGAVSRWPMTSRLRQTQYPARGSVVERTFWLACQTA